MPFYTSKGDQGTTDLQGGKRVQKDHPLIEVLGSIDELNAWMGIARAQSQDTNINEILQTLQAQLYEIMGEISIIESDQKPFEKKRSNRIRLIEDLIDKNGKNIETPGRFLAPGDSLHGSSFNMLRVITRRVERKIVHISGEFPNLDQIYTAYFNRLSSLFYLLWIREK